MQYLVQFGCTYWFTVVNQLGINVSHLYDLGSKMALVSKLWSIFTHLINQMCVYVYTCVLHLMGGGTTTSQHHLNHPPQIHGFLSLPTFFFFSFSFLIFLFPLYKSRSSFLLPWGFFNFFLLWGGLRDLISQSVQHENCRARRWLCMGTFKITVMGS